MKTYELRSPEAIAALTEKWGFLPFFAGMAMTLTPFSKKYDEKDEVYGQDEMQLVLRKRAAFGIS